MIKFFIFDNTLLFEFIKFFFIQTFPISEIFRLAFITSFIIRTLDTVFFVWYKTASKLVFDTVIIFECKVIFGIYMNTIKRIIIAISMIAAPIATGSILPRLLSSRWRSTFGLVPVCDVCTETGAVFL